MSRPASPSKPLGLAIIGKLEVPSTVEQHRFYREATAALQELADEEQVSRQIVGTSNLRKKVELYGWNPNIPSHADNTGIIYAVCLTAGISTLYAQEGLQSGGGQELKVELEQGSVFRLDDHLKHWTKDTTPRICAFLGPLKDPDDQLAMSMLAEAVDHLAQGHYSGAPRVGRGFVRLQPDECWATNDFETREIRLINDAKDQDWYILNCSTCSAPAVVIDHFWPYHDERTSCRACREEHQHLAGL